ncbi:MAG: hypothetical protein ACYS83_08535 [Planctomycetota bacterium]
MKKSILVAAVSVGIMLLSRAVMGGLALVSGTASVPGILIPLVVAVLILVGIINGHRLAWQWGRVLGLFSAVVLSLVAVAALANAKGQPGRLLVGLLVALQGVPLFAMFFALGTQGAKEHFRLICPECGSTKAKGGNFLFTKAVCKKCKVSWE